MQLQAETNPALNTVTAYGDNFIEINAVSYGHAVHFGPEGQINKWDVERFSDISARSLQEIVGIESTKQSPLDFLDGRSTLARPPDAPEVLLVGTGQKQHMLPDAMTRPLLELGIGVEAMSTYAAARTYNILMSEGRRVMVALLPLESL